jgi:hypothetical protein
VIRLGVGSLSELTKSGHLESRRTRGRPFAKGNPGRKPGSKNKTTVIAQALPNGGLELVQTGYEQAKAGSVPMLKFFLERILPRDRLIQIELPPMKHASDAAGLLGAIIDAAGRGQITPNEAAALGHLVETRARIMNNAEINLRLDDLEKRQTEVQDLLERWLKCR